MGFLTPLKNDKKYPQVDLITADIETDKDGELLDIGCYSLIGYFTFTNWEDFLDFLPKKSVVWFHNGGRFDAINAVSKLSYKLHWTASLAGTKIVRLEFLEKKIVFCDSACLLLSSLDKLAKTFDVTDKKISIDKKYISDMGSFKKDFPVNYYEYLEHDCLSLYQILYNFKLMLFKKFGIDKIPLTVASLAMLLWRKNYLQVDIYTPHQKQLEYLKKGYFGGRVEYAGYGVKKNGLYYKVNMIDVNSMYPSVMLGDFPIGELYFTDNFKKNGGKKLAYGMYRVSYYIPETIRHSPFIGAKTKDGFIFCHKSDEAYLTHEDLELITKLKGTYEILDCYYCLETYPIFKTYVLDLYDIKSNADSPAMILIAKYLLNSLYGKLGQKLEREEIINITENSTEFFIKTVASYNKKFEDAMINDFFELSLEDYFNEVKIYHETETNTLFSHVTETNILRSKSNPLIAAYVTARARRVLWAQMEQHNTIYVDTDSLVTQSKIKAKISDKLGDWGIEAEDKIIDVRGKKSYTIFNNDMTIYKSRSKGFKTFKKDEKELIHESEFVGENITPKGFKTWCNKPNIAPSKFEKTERRNKRQKSTAEKAALIAD